MNIETLLQDYLNYLEIEKNRSPKTRENYERYLKEFLKFAKVKNVESITDRLVTEFRLFLARRDIKKITQSYYAIAIRNFLKYLIKSGFNAFHPSNSSFISFASSFSSHINETSMEFLDHDMSIL